MKVNPVLLILDDEESIRLSLASYLEDRGWTVLTASTGPEALEIIKERPVDAAIVDIRLHGMTGEAFVRAAIAEGLETVFVFYTGSHQFVVDEDLLTSGRVCPTVYSKPVKDMAVLQEELRAMLRAIKTGQGITGLRRSTEQTGNGEPE